MARATVRSAPLVALAGPPGVGKSTIAARVAADVPCDGKPLGGRRRKRLLAARLLVRRSTVGPTILLLGSVLLGGTGPLRGRLDRVRLVGRGLLRVTAPRPRPRLLDDGPIDYVAAMRWSSPRTERRAQRAVARILAREGAVVILVSDTPERIAARLSARETAQPTLPCGPAVRSPHARTAAYLLADEVVTGDVDLEVVRVHLAEVAPDRAESLVRSALTGGTG
jgi:DNA polymerase III delta prime subunit